jgi:hypothetical protein
MQVALVAIAIMEMTEAQGSYRNGTFGGRFQKHEAPAAATTSMFRMQHSFHCVVGDGGLKNPAYVMYR